MNRRALLQSLLLQGPALFLGARASRSAFGKAADNGAGFDAFLQSLQAQAEQTGVKRETFEAITSALTYDSSVPSGVSAQAEFDKPLSAYLAQAVSAARVSRGQLEANRWQGELTSITRRSGVPGEICLAAWGMETDFGRDMGTRDALRTLASLAYKRSDRTLFIDEFIAAMIIAQRGIPRDKLKGSWAGAMGHPQFLPSAYLKYAQSFSGQGAPDIWESIPDSLASIGHFLQQSGWRAELPWGMEVLLPHDYDFGDLKQTFPAFARQGIHAADGKTLPTKGEATLFLPSGFGGPAFLVSENYYVLKAYNNSDSYALSLGRLADRIGGADSLVAQWPRQEKMLSRKQKSDVQHLLTERGLYSGTIDGRFGPASRDAINRFQRASGLRPADGYGTIAVLQALQSGKAR